MSISNENQGRINQYFKTDPEMIEKLYQCDADAIRKVGSISQRGINPDDVIVAYESGNPSTMNYLYQQAKKLVELQELYKDLCFEYYKKTKNEPEQETQTSSNKRSI